MTTSIRLLSRGEFLKISAAAGLGLVLGCYVSTSNGLAYMEASEPFAPNVWLKIESNDVVTIVIHRAELGQKVWTSLPRIVAEELEADWDKVSIVHGNFNPAFGGQITGGSASVSSSYDKLREAGATALAMLKAAAARQWGVDVASCSAADSVIMHTATNRKMTYGELTVLAAAEEVPENVVLKDPKDFKLIGTSVKSVEGESRVRGTAVYGMDFTLPDMVYATTVRCPVFGGMVGSIDDVAAKQVPGVVDVVQISTGVAVLANDTWSALEGAKALNVTWEEGDFAGESSADITEKMREYLDVAGETYRDDGDAASVLQGASGVLEATYEGTYLDHAPIEPLNCIARVSADLCEIWVSTQAPEIVHMFATGVTGLPDEAIRVNMLLVGGAYGRKLQGDYVQEALEISMATGRTIKLTRTRTEDIQHGTYRPASINRIRGLVDDQGKPTAWYHKISSPVAVPQALGGGSDAITGYGAGEMPYAIDNIRIETSFFENPIPYGPLRSVGNTQIAFANECFMDELAEAATADPYEYRRGLLNDHPRLLGVLDLVAEKADWGNPREGIYQGIATHACFGSFAAVVAEISLLDDGKIKLERMVGTIDCGRVINPWGVEHQIEGGIIFALSLACHMAITLENGAVEQSNYHNYKLLTMGEAPKVEVHIVESTEQPTGVGEPPVPPTAPALVNAIYAATGNRIYELPLSKHGLI